MYRDEQDKEYSYRTYIKNFQWNYRKYNIKLPLAELQSAFAKTQSLQDMLLKKHQDELNAKKQELAALQRKEGGNLNSRDYTDDIYQSAELNKSVFVEGKMEGSDMFTNLLVVCQRAKFQLFYDELNTLMTDYYENLDKNE